LRSHRTQLAPDHPFRVIPDDLAEEFLGHEYFVRARPRDPATDWLQCVVRRTPERSAADPTRFEE
jgi:hypothetical protein